MAVKAIPAVLLGCLLNILDGVSYGMIVFPATGVFADLGPMGVSMFFVSAIIAQLVYTLGGSGFAGANGSMMIEVVPFFHILATSIADQIGEDDPGAVIATTLAAYAFSSILTGFFFLLGALKLGVLVGFFPRHILVGCIGGVGVFLVETGLTVSMRISDDDFDYSLTTLRFMFEPHNLILWSLPLTLAILLRVITHKFHHQLIFPLYFLVIPVIFYVVVWSAKLELVDLRHTGWIFDIGATAHEPWYKFYSYFDFGKIRYSALWSTLPTQFALLFFNILHPPLNVPALAVSLNNDVDTNKELVAHGYSNLLSGLIGSVPNYLVYVNTLLFYRVGGDNRIAGFLLAIATAVLLVLGTGPIAFLPVMVVGALIYVLGIDLIKEALWDTRHRVTWSEYITIASIMITMTLWDFVIGVIFGIVVSCFFFVIQNSQLRSIRSIYTGNLAMSAVRRPSLQRAYIREVSKQTTILRLQGFLFFGTITYVEETIRSLIEGPYWHQHPVQFLVLDLSLVAGVDMSSAEAFVRIQRLLAARYVTLVFCGFAVESPVGKALQSVEVLGASGVELFSTFSDAMEWTENAYLRAWLKSQKLEISFLAVPGRPDADIGYNHLVGSFVRSPRRSHIRDVGERTIATEIPTYPHPDPAGEPLHTLQKAFSSYGNVDPILFQPISNYLEQVTAPTGAILWRQGEPSNGLFVIETGVLRASYTFANPNQHFEESMVAGTLAGELSALAEAPRNATVVVEQGPAIMWRLEGANLKRMQLEEPELARVFVQLVLKAAQLDYDILLSAIASRQ
ncbi:sulfate transporter family-domain-containing protein [Crepidotus variabilis]|uniref:Sulfate transporter family-domain-containing protein n=1 Tax=Crepidotus variabilis TaxID=179855 RepID=A0A9P6JLL0_9AGAR|nr:sulfate transporter family-domain-containing protein [Crepidotus variabilis]